MFEQLTVLGEEKVLIMAWYRRGYVSRRAMGPLTYTRPWSALILPPYSTPAGTQNPTGYPDSEIRGRGGRGGLKKIFFRPLGLILV